MQQQTMLTRTRPKPTSAEIFRDLEFTVYRMKSARLLERPKWDDVDDEYFDEINDLIVDVEEALQPGEKRPVWLESLYKRWSQRPSRPLDDGGA